MIVMGTNVMNRRQFLALSGLAVFGAGIGVRKLMQLAGSARENTLYSASDNVQGQHFASALDLSTQQIVNQILPFRAHALIPLENQQLFYFGRRPALQSALVDFSTLQTRLIDATVQRHFGGHGCLSTDRSILFTTENDYDGKRGIIGIRDCTTLQVLGEYESYGLDPHDIQLMPDGRTLVVANGGIETHPDFGRRKLNLDTMQPSLVYIDSYNGQKLAEYRLPDHQLSIRHLIVSERGDVGVALQYEGNLYHQQPQSLVAWQAKDQALQLLPIPSQILPRFQGYMADLAYDVERDILAVTSPRGRHIAFWHTQSAQFLAQYPLNEPSGIAFNQQQERFIVSDANGNIHAFNWQANQMQASLVCKVQQQWDNHLYLV